MSLIQNQSCPTSIKSCADFCIAYEIAEALESRWLIPTPDLPPSDYKFIGLQFEYRNWQLDASKPLLPSLVVRQAYQTTAPGTPSVVLFPENQADADVVKSYAKVLTLQGEGHHRVIGALEGTDLELPYLYEYLEYHLPKIPDFVFFGTQQLEYLLERFKKIYLSGYDSNLGIPWYTLPDDQPQPTKIPSLKIEGNELRNTTPGPVDSVPQAGAFTGIECPRRWFDYPQ